MHLGHFVYRDFHRNINIDKRLAKRVRLTAFIPKRDMDDYKREVPDARKIVPITREEFDYRNISYARSLKDYIEQHSIDVFFINLHHWGALLTFKLLARGKVLEIYYPGSFRLIRSFSGLRYRLDSVNFYLKRRVGVSLANEITTTTRYSGKIIRKMFPKKDGHIHSLPSAIPYTFEAPVDARILRDIPSDAKVVLLPGRMGRYKGVEYVVKAAPFIAQAIPEAKVVIAGPTPSRDYNFHGNAAGHDNIIVIPRRFSLGESNALYKRAAVVLAPYLEMASDSAVVNTAYAHNKAVVVTDVGPLPEQVENEKTGFIIPPRDPSAIAEAVVKILSDAKLRRAMEGYIEYKNRSAWEPIIAKYIEIFERSLHSNNERRVDSQVANYGNV